MSINSFILVYATLMLSGVARADQPDILFADFESPDYGHWRVIGSAFGTGPARGALPGQMAVSGFKGKGLVNSFAGGDSSTGMLTSPEFKIARRSIGFLIGGGGFEEKTCVNLVVGEKVVRSAAGPNTASEGSEALEPAGWNVEDLIGKTAQIVIIDNATGGWGHINVDHIVFTDQKVNTLIVNPSREITAAGRYLHFPVRNGAKEKRVSVSVDGKIVREFTIGMADGEPDWWAPLEISAWAGKRIVVKVDKLLEESKALESITVDDAVRGTDQLYREPLRSQLHVSPRRGWTNDPNGMVYADGEYHLFFQANPYGTQWGNMHWGHLISTDLVHWNEQPIALYPPRFGDWAFSGSAVADKNNTSGWKKGDQVPLVAAFTSTGRGECIIYSTDRGRSWTEYAGNPVIKHTGRDPRLLWYAPGKQWVMALYDEADKKQSIVFYTSPDLKQWTYQSKVDGFFECPDLFELPVDNDKNNRKWVLTAADSDYMVGTFDGKTFTPETPKLTGSQGRAFYAAQTFSDDPKGRIVQVGWLRAESPGMSFNQCFSMPLELALKSTAQGPRLTWRPVAELSALEGKTHSVAIKSLRAADPNPLAGIEGEILRIDAEFRPSADAVVTFEVRGVPVKYEAASQKLTIGMQTVTVPLVVGKLAFSLYVDRTVFELFANGGRFYVPVAVIPKAENVRLSVGVKGGDADFSRLEVRELASIWKR